MKWKRGIPPATKEKLFEQIQRAWVWNREFEKAGDYVEEILSHHLRNLCSDSYEAVVEGNSRAAYALIGKLEQYVYHLSCLRIERGHR